MNYEGNLLKSNSYGDFVVLRVFGEYCEIKFIETGSVSTVTNNNAINGRVKDRFKPTISSVGYIGVGRFKTSHEYYPRWVGMIKRCYDKRCKSYVNYGNEGCTVCDEWHNFQNFAEWVESEHLKRSIKGKFEIDKDIKVPGNKVYSPSACTLVTKLENIKAKSKEKLQRNNTSGHTGIHLSYGKWVVRIDSDGVRNVIGRFKDKQDAIDAKADYLKKLKKEGA